MWHLLSVAPVHLRPEAHKQTRFAHDHIIMTSQCVAISFRQMSNLREPVKCFLLPASLLFDFLSFMSRCDVCTNWSRRGMCFLLCLTVNSHLCKCKTLFEGRLLFMFLSAVMCMCIQYMAYSKTLYMSVVNWTVMLYILHIYCK